MNLKSIATGAAALAVAGTAAVVFAGPASAAPYNPNIAQSATISATAVTAGGNLTVNIINVGANATLIMYIESAPVQIGSGAVDGQGNGSVTGRVPSGYSGTHTILVNASSGESFSQTITVSASGGSGSGSSGSGGGLANTGAAVAGIGILGAALVGGGVFFVMAGRRRRDGDATV